MYYSAAVYPIVEKVEPCGAPQVLFGLDELH